jgi:hypothetical protein
MRSRPNLFRYLLSLFFLVMMGIFLCMETGGTETAATETAGAKRQYTLTVYVSPPGAGYVTKYPDKVNYTRGERVKLTAVPAANYCFYGWSGDVCGFWNPITIIMDGNKTVTALFRQKKCPKSPNPCGNL